MRRVLRTVVARWMSLVICDWEALFHDIVVTRITWRFRKTSGSRGVMLALNCSWIRPFHPRIHHARSDSCMKNEPSIIWSAEGRFLLRNFPLLFPILTIVRWKWKIVLQLWSIFLPKEWWDKLLLLTKSRDTCQLQPIFAVWGRQWGVFLWEDKLPWILHGSWSDCCRSVLWAEWGTWQSQAGQWCSKTAQGQRNIIYIEHLSGWTWPL